MTASGVANTPHLMASDIKPLAVRVYPQLKARAMAYMEKRGIRSLHATVLELLDSALTAAGFPGDAPPAKVKKAPLKPKSKAFEKIKAGLEQAVAHANGEDVGVVVHEPKPTAKPNLKDWLGT